jgi:Fe-S cluster biogenesis protein NfuA
MTKNLEKAIEKIRSILNMDGGDLEIVNFDEKKNIIEIKLLGVCQHCPMAELTITGFIQEELKKAIPNVKVIRKNNEKTK